jgi:hypothetical protein
MRCSSVFSAASMKMQLEGQAAAHRKQATHFSRPFFVALQHVRAAEALLEHCSAQGAFAVRVVFHLGGLEDLSEGDAHALGNGGDVAHD